MRLGALLVNRLTAFLDARHEADDMAVMEVLLDGPIRLGELQNELHMNTGEVWYAHKIMRTLGRMVRKGLVVREMKREPNSRGIAPYESYKVAGD